MQQVEELALLGALAFGAYELYHLHKYGNFGIGNPYNNSIGTGGYDVPYGYGGTTAGYGFTNPTFGSHHHHRHHHHSF